MHGIHRHIHAFDHTSSCTKSKKKNRFQINAYKLISGFAVEETIPLRYFNWWAHSNGYFLSFDHVTHHRKNYSFHQLGVHKFRFEKSFGFNYVQSRSKSHMNVLKHRTVLSFGTIWLFSVLPAKLFSISQF